MRILQYVQATLTAACGVSLILSFFLASQPLAILAAACGSVYAIRSAGRSVRDRQIDVNMLMVLAAAGAIATDFIGVRRGERWTGLHDAAALLFLFSLSSTLESFAMARTRSAIAGLVRLRPSQAILVVDGSESKVNVEALKIGDSVRIPPFESIPVDGNVIDGKSSVDQSSMTGESKPVTKSVGDDLLSGTTNLEGSLLMNVRSIVGDSTLDKVVALVQSAQENKASGERISLWFGQRYTLFVLAIFGLSLLVRLVIGEGLGPSLYSSIILLVALSPCALVISTPAATLSALAWAARHGILVRGGQYIELAGKTEILALDKTGTLTTGKPRLSEICVCAAVAAPVGRSEGTCENEACWNEGQPMSPEARRLIGSAAAAEAYSAHPIGLSIRAAAIEHGIVVPVSSDHGAVPGLGVSAKVDGRDFLLGQQQYIESRGIRLPEEFVEHIDKLQRGGMTVAVMSDGGSLAALGFLDAPRDGAERFLAEARRSGVKRIAMLTGDTSETAEHVGRKLGIEEIYSGLLPDAKNDMIAKLASDGDTMMVGDGINDAPSLARASVGVAMGGLGSDIAMNAADVVLMHDRLDRIPELIQLGKKANSIIRTNLLFATGVIVTLTLFSFVVQLPLPLAVIGHEGSTVIVILNGLRLLKGP